MLFFQQVKGVADGCVRRAQHLVAMLDKAAVHVLVDLLDNRVGHFAALAQLFPAQHGNQNRLAHAALPVALEQQALAFDPFVHVVEHVVGAGQDEPVAVADVDLLEVVVVVDAAGLLAGLPDFGLAVFDTRYHAVGQGVNF